MSDAFWKCSDDGLIQPACLPPAAGKRPRTAYDAPSGPEKPDSYSRSNEQGIDHVIRDADPIEASYERYLQSGQISSAAGGESLRSMSIGAISHHPIDDPHGMGTVEGGRPEVVRLPPNASSTLYGEGLPPNCTRRELSHIFRPFVGYKEVRLVTKGGYAGGDTYVYCFVDFVSPTDAATAMETLQGYKFDEHDRDSGNLRLQFARRPGVRSGGGHRARR